MTRAPAPTPVPTPAPTPVISQPAVQTDSTIKPPPSYSFATPARPTIPGNEGASGFNFGLGETPSSSLSFAHPIGQSTPAPVATTTATAFATTAATAFATTATTTANPALTLQQPAGQSAFSFAAANQNAAKSSLQDPAAAATATFPTPEGQPFAALIGQQPKTTVPSTGFGSPANRSTALDTSSQQPTATKLFGAAGSAPQPAGQSGQFSFKTPATAGR